MQNTQHERNITVTAHSVKRSALIRIFALHGSTELTQDHTFYKPEDADAANFKTIAKYLRSNFFSAGSLATHNGKDYIQLVLKEGDNWGRILSPATNSRNIVSYRGEAVPSNTQGKSIEEYFRSQIEADIRTSPLVHKPVEVEMDAKDPLKSIKDYLQENTPAIIKKHGGNITVVDFQDGILTMSFRGVCNTGCFGSKETTKRIIDNQIREDLAGLVKKTKYVDPAPAM